MTKTIRYITSTIVILTMVFGSMAMMPAPRSNTSVYLNSGSFIPAQNQVAANGSRKYFIVQFTGPVQQSWKDEITAEGAEILEYIPDFAFKVRMNPSIASRVGQKGFVAAVTSFQPQFKFGADLKRGSGTNLYQIRIEKGSDYGLIRSLIAQTGAQVLGFEENMLYVAANSAFIDAIVQVDDVASINNFYLNETTSAPDGPKQNDNVISNIIGAVAAHSRGYNGSSQIVAVADTGLGGGTTTTAHRDMPSSRIAAIFNWPGIAGGCFQTIVDDGAVDVSSGHGTHTAGSVLSGGASNGIGKGSAPGANLVFQSTENYAVVSSVCQSAYGLTNGYYLTGIPSDLNQLYQQAYAAGARIHSNSWGNAAAGDYTLNSANTDTFVWNNRDMVITFSAGNEGTDANSDGIIDNDSMGAPATAKNVITVGASENQRSGNYPCDTSLTYTTCAVQNGSNSIFTWGSSWPSDFPANPIKSDNSANSSAQMAAFSGRGPTDDGRIKPDVVAPGSWILSTYSDMYQQGYDATPNPRNNTYQSDGWGFPYDAYYKYMGGTSMSNPLVAGGAAVVKDYYSKAYGINASAALVKATIINSAVDMLDENNDGINDNSLPIPNNHEGWGLVNLDGATDGTIAYVDESAGLDTGGSASFQVTSNGGPLKVTIAWTDYPSTDTAAINLVNDLDLTVSGPSGTFIGNVFSGGWSTTGGTADRRNNVENVYIQSAAAGTYTITVSGFNVPNGTQKYALAVDDDTVSSPPTPASSGFLSPTAQAAVTANSGDNNGFQTSPVNAFANDTLLAIDIDSGSGKKTTCTDTGKDRHQFYNYGFNIPSGTVKGIEVRLDARSDSTSGTPSICVEISWNGGVSWTAVKSTPVLSTTEATYILGGIADTWGRTWASGDFSNTNFRVRLTNIASNTARDFYLDYIAVNVTY